MRCVPKMLLMERTKHCTVRDSVIVWIHRYCAGVSGTHFEALSASSDPFLCVGCFQKSCKEELVDLRNTVSILREEVAQLRRALDEKHVNEPVNLNADKHSVGCQGGECGARDSGRGGGWGRSRGRGRGGGHVSRQGRGYIIRNGGEAVEGVAGVGSDDG